MPKICLVLFLLAGYGKSTAQLGVSKLANNRIGKSTFFSDDLGKPSTPACQWPQLCGANPGCPVYTFIGKGDWRIPGNWEFGIMPPEILPSCFQILINPAGTENCILPAPQYLMPGSHFEVLPGKHIIIPGNVQQKD